QLGIYLVYLPPYSPDLNPIEFVWKSIKRRFSRLVESLSFAESWIEKFIPSWI
ncbi:MAG: transposase, partial [Candidatus Syntrophoarchaeum sp.]|nr:transposase [Candidatus Syntrophoarchaeum sp.]